MVYIQSDDQKRHLMSKIFMHTIFLYLSSVLNNSCVSTMSLPRLIPLNMYLIPPDSLLVLYDNFYCLSVTTLRYPVFYLILRCLESIFSQQMKPYPDKTTDISVCGHILDLVW